MAGDEGRLFPVGPASHRVGLSVQRIRQLADAGVLDCIRDAGGRRLITERSLDKLRARREREGQNRSLATQAVR
jgi:DNA-binding transcriptional MerR regulator